MKNSRTLPTAYCLLCAALLSAALPIKKAHAQWADVLAYDNEAGYPLSISSNLKPAHGGKTVDLVIQVKDFETVTAGYYILYRINSVDQFGTKTVVSAPLRMTESGVYREENQTPDQPDLSVFDYRASIDVTSASPRLVVESFVYQVTDGANPPSPFWGQLSTVAAKDGIPNLRGDPFPGLWARKVASPTLEYATKMTKVFASTPVAYTLNIKATAIPNPRANITQRRALTAKAQAAARAYSDQAISILGQFGSHARPQTPWHPGYVPVGTGGLQTRVTLQGELASNQVSNLNAKLNPLYGNFSQTHPEGRITISISR